ncbi:P-loop containing nucleoside triphosphate hydrolase protein [Stachybotrys elegans]|uniref:P-loop containing nucleoside triphosphate hydrolase protein n=1 Tax=Stachybotrys elegans TaxID=80388 RepID=A0A8K0SGG0_9HYPO|nr:P-loop containing nucleoside triphosphate hydrolase protein [Stachybotrys elegans]
MTYNGYSGPEVVEARPGPPGAMLMPSNAEDSLILEAMDKLRDLGIDRQYDLPQIIVCGSQSAGKSSVLESLVQIPFPRDENTCTKYVTKVTIVPSPISSVKVRIQPSPERPEDEKIRLRSFSEEDDSEHYAEKLEGFMTQANDEIFTSSAEHKLITKDVLLITVTGPGNRHLQVLDLPGLIAFDQRESGNEHMIETMVTHYMAMKQSMILAVIKGSEDLNNQKVLKLCKKYDPKGHRTLGVITRPDVAEDVQKRNLIRIMQGQDPDFRFSHQWHVVRNRTSQELDAKISQKQRDDNEMELLGRVPWNVLDRRCLGIKELRDRLNEMLFSVAKKELPALCEVFRERLGQLKGQFNALGGDEYGDDELRSAFEQATTRLRNAARDHARGLYESDINNWDPRSAIMLRSRVVELDEVFRDKLVERGHKWKTLVRPSLADPDSDLGSIYVPEGKPAAADSSDQMVHADLKAEVAWVVKKLKASRGSNLPTFFDPKSINNLFWTMSEGWNTISREHVDKVYSSCRAYFKDISPVAFKRRSGPNGSEGFSNSKKVAERFVEPFLIPKLKESRESAVRELEKLEQDRLDFTISADMRFLKDRRAHRQGREFSRALQAHHEIDLDSPGSGSTAERLDQTTYARHARLHTQQELAEDTAETYLDAMWSHYLIDRDIYIINVQRQVIERHFLRHIEELVPKLQDFDDIKKLTMKDSSEEIQKQKIKKEIENLESSLDALDGIR